MEALRLPLIKRSEPNEIEAPQDFFEPWPRVYFQISDLTNRSHPWKCSRAGWLVAEGVPAELVKQGVAPLDCKAVVQRAGGCSDLLDGSVTDTEMKTNTYLERNSRGI